MNKLAQVPIGERYFGGKHFLTELPGIGKLVSIIVANAIVIAGIILLFFMVAGGIGMIISAGKDNPEQAEKSKKTITSALIGFIIIFAAYWIVQIIGKITGVNILGF